MGPFAQRGHFDAKLARKVYDIYKSGSWEQLGYESLEDWGKKELRLTKSTIYKYVKIIKYYGHCTDEEIEQTGPETLHQMARQCEEEGINLGAIGHDNNATRKELRERLKAELRKKAGAKAVYGEILEPSFRGLEHAPVREQGVVFLFGMVSEALRFRVQAIRTGFPDCIAKQKIPDRRGKEHWRPVRIEFEYTSKDFYGHGHSPKDADIIVCWEDNLSPKPDGCPEVLELKSKIKTLNDDPRKL